MKKSTSAVFIGDPYSQTGSISSVAKGFTTVDSSSSAEATIHYNLSPDDMSKITTFLDTILSTLEGLQEQINYLQATVDSIEAEIEDLKHDY